jgi:hypothetical protein
MWITTNDKHTLQVSDCSLGLLRDMRKFCLEDEPIEINISNETLQMMLNSDFFLLKIDDMVKLANLFDFFDDKDKVTECLQRIVALSVDADDSFFKTIFRGTVIV